MFAVATNSNAVDPWQGAPLPQLSECASPQLSSACALLAVLVQTQGSSQTSARIDIELDHQKIEELKQHLAEAIDAARRAADDGGFFGFLGDIFGSDIAQIAGAVAAVAATISTGGAAAPMLLIVLSEALEVGAKIGAELGLPPELCVAMSVASVGLGLLSGTGTAQAVGDLADAARTVKLGAKIVQGGAVATGGVLHGVSGYYQKQQLEHQADAVDLEAHREATSLDIDDAIALLSRALRTQHRETSTVAEIIDSNTDTDTALCNRI